MHNSLSLESVRVELRRRGLPSEYVERVVGELQDHRSDIIEEQQKASPDGEIADTVATDRLGDPKELADLLVSQYRARSFSGRHPVVTFLLAPIPLAVATWAAFVAVFILAAKAIDYTLGDASVTHPLVIWAAHLAHYASMFLPPAIATVILCRLASRSGRGWPWLVAASALVALLALSYHSSLTVPVTPGTGRFVVGLGISTQPFHFPQVLQMAVPLAIGALFLCRSQSRRQLLLPV